MTVTDMKGNENTVIALPDGWKWVKLEDLLYLNDSGIWGTQDLLDGLLVIRSVNFRNNGSISTENLAKIIPNTLNIQNKRLIGGDILLERSGGGPKQPVGRVALFTLDGKYYFGNFISRLRCKSNVDSNFLFLYLHSIHLNGVTIQLQDQTTGIRNLRFSEYLQLPIPLPPTLAEQERIARILNKQILVVEKARTAAEARLEAAKALPAAYLRAVFKSEEAKGWPKQRLGDYATKVGSGLTPLGGQSTYQKSGIPLIRSQNVHMNHFVLEGLAYISKEIDGKMAGSRVHPSDVLLNITGASIGRVCVVPSELCPANVNQHVSIIRCNDSLNPDFLSFYISTPEFQKFIMNTQAGATRQALTKTIIEQFEIPVPPLEEQSHLVATLLNEIGAAEKVIQVLQEERGTIDALPAALLRRAFTGGL